MTPDQLRELAEMTPVEAERLANETFDLIERSEASGNSYEANLPVGADDDEIADTSDLPAGPGVGDVEVLCGNIAHGTYPHVVRESCHEPEWMP